MSRLAARALVCRRGPRTVLESIDVAFAADQVTAIIGPNGSGKTTLLRHLAGLDRAAGGDVELDGAPLGQLAAGVRARRIAYLPQGASVYWPLLGRDLVALGRLPHGADLGRPLAAPDADAVERALRRVDGLAFADRTVDALSQGERARLLLARTLATEAEILLADEPVASLDPAYALDTMSVLRAEAAARRLRGGEPARSWAGRAVRRSGGRAGGRQGRGRRAARRGPAAGRHRRRVWRRVPHRQPRGRDATGSVVTAALSHRLRGKRHRRHNFHGPRYGEDTPRRYRNSRWRDGVTSSRLIGKPVHSWLICLAAL